MALAVLAGAIAALARHPDPPIDALLRDATPGATDVLRDLLLERARPAEPLLRDLAWTPGLPALALPEDAAIDRDLRALWGRVVELDPMIDPAALGPPVASRDTGSA